jgi:DNA modification methylase
MHEDTIVGNALFLPFESESFDAYATSPTYSNRMADSHHAKDSSVRNTYTHKLGRRLHPDNSGAMQWGDAYRQFHTAAWTEAIRVIKPGGRFILNIKDHIRAGSVIPVTEWHDAELIRLGLDHVLGAQIEHSGNGFGQNGKARVPYESVILFQKP